MAQSWTNTRKTLEKLKKLLNCSCCLQPYTDPYILESCGHTFCRACIKNEVCPQCNISALAKQIKPNRLVGNISLLATQLQNVLDDNSVPLQNENGHNSVEPPLRVQSPVSSESECVAEKIQKALRTEDSTGKDKEATPSVSCDANERTMNEMDETGYCTSTSTSTPAKKLSQSHLNHLKVDGVIPVKTTAPIYSNSEKKNAKGETPLHVACIKGDVDKVRSLLEEGAIPNVKDHAGWTPLHEASHHNYVDMVKLLLQSGAYVNTPGYDNETALHDAVQMDNAEVVSILVRHSADVNARNSRGLIPMDLAKTEEVMDALKSTVSVSLSKASPAPSAVSQQVVILCTALTKKQKHKLQLCSKTLHLTLVNGFNDKVTHIVTNCDEEGQCIRTLKYLQGILLGKWILNFTWIDMCLEYKKKLDEEAFEVAGTNNCPNSFGARKGRENALQQLPQLFDGCSFYLHGDFPSPWPARSELSSLIRIGGGKVLKREPRYSMKDGEIHRVPYHLKDNIVDSFVVHVNSQPPKLNNVGDNVRCVHISWLLDSISTYTLLQFNYRH